MEKLNYTPDISHCPGARQRLCTRCARYLFLRRWKETDPDLRRPVLLIPPRFKGVTCPAFFDVSRIDPAYYKRHSR